MSDLEARVQKLEHAASVTLDIAAAIAQQLAEAVARVVEADPHHFSPRPCPSCRTISGLLGRAYGCNAKAKR